MFHLELPRDYPNNVKCIVIMYGWFGSTPKHVKKYAEQYTERGCAVVYGTAPPLALIYKLDFMLDKVVLESISKAADVVREVERANNGKEHTPIILHAFSSGSSVLERLHVLSYGSKFEPLAKKKSNEDLQLVTNRLANRGFEVMDSCPVLDVTAAKRAVRVVFPNVFLSSFINFFIGIGYAVIAIRDAIQGLPTLEARTWENMTSNKVSSHGQMIIYSDIDAVAEASSIESFIEERRKRGVYVVSKNFKDSYHVLHFKKYPKEYLRMIEQAIDTVSKAPKKRLNSKM